MNKKLMFAALGLGLIATSCSQDEVVSMNPDNAIAFRASTMSSTRASETTLDNINAFTTYAYTSDGSQFMKEKVYREEVKDENEEVKWKYDGLKYWPNTGTLDFYSYAPFDLNFATYTGAGEFGEFTIPTDASNQKDFLYAVNTGLSKQINPVPVAFKHALSQIIFNAKTTSNCNLTVTIDKVSICKVEQKAAGFKFENKSISDGGNSTTVGTWTAATTATQATFVTEFDAITLIGASQKEELTTSLEGAMFLLPQELTAWDVKDKNGNPASQNGAYFLVSCSIKDKDGKYIWGAAATDEDHGTKDVAIPLDVTWEMGKKYIYTFVFGEGAGYNPKPEPDPNPDPEPILVPITFTVESVDAFIAGNGNDGEDINM